MASAATPRPDLAGRPLQLVPTATASCLSPRFTGSVDFEVRNQGAAASPPAEGIVYEDLDGDGRLSPGDSVLSRFAVLPLAPCERTPLSVVVDAPIAFKGSPIRIALDAARTIAETDETNNVVDFLDECRDRTPVDYLPVARWSDDPPDCFYVVAAGLIAQLTDDNGDGRIDENDVPDVVSFGRTNGSDDWVFRLLDGSTGIPFATFGLNALGLRSCPTSQFDTLVPAIGDLDGDGVPEIVVELFDATSHEARIAALHLDGSPMWITPVPNPTLTCTDTNGVILDDLDGDGSLEVISKWAVLDAAGNIRWINPFNKPNGRVYGDGDPVIVDLDLDGTKEIVAAAAALRADGTILWQHRDATMPGYVPPLFQGGGYHAAVHLRAGGVPQLYFAARSDPTGPGVSAYLLDGPTGLPLWGPTPLTPDGLPSPIAAGDFDGDGLPDAVVGINNPSRIVAFGSDGTVLWQKSLPCCFDSFAGAPAMSLFDFDGDGRPEILYQGFKNLNVLDARDGSSLAIFAGSPQATGPEGFVTVADLDHDGRADLVAPISAFDLSACGMHAYRNPTWWGARGTWPGYAYHVNDVDARGCPVPEESLSWCDHNSWRQQRALAPRLADVTVSVLRASLAGCPLLELTARVGSAGGRPVPAGTAVTFFDGDPSIGGLPLGTVATTIDLRSGTYQDVTLTIAAPAAGVAALYARAAPIAQECDPENTCGGLTVPACGASCVAVARCAPIESCAGAAVTLDSAGSSLTGCGQSAEFRFRQGATIVRDWAPDPTCVWTTPISGSYEVDIRCPSDTSCNAIASASLSEKPDPLPGDQGNALLAVKNGTDVDLSFAAAPSPGPWRLYRDPSKLALGTTALTPDAGLPSFTDTGVVPAPPPLLFYRLKGLSPCSLTPGP